MQKILKKKTITLDELAGMVQHGFEGVDKKIHDLRAEMNQRFDEINERFNDIEARLDRLEKVLFEEQHERMIRLEDRVQKMESDFRALLSAKR